MISSLLRPGLRVVIAGTISARHRVELDHYYAGAGNNFWRLLHLAGLTPSELSPERDDELLRHGIGLVDVVGSGPDACAAFDEEITAAAPGAVAFVSKTAATRYAQGRGHRLPRTYGPLQWMVAGHPAFVLPGPSGANNAMPIPLRAALWRDLADFLELLSPSGAPATRGGRRARRPAR